MRAVLCARHSRSMAAQLVAFDSGCCAVSAGCTAPLVFLPTSAGGPARHGRASRRRAAAWRPRSLCMPGESGARTQSCAFGCRGRRASFGGDGREWHYVLGLVGADCAEDSLAASQLGFATGDARRILGCHLGVAYDAERGQHPEDRSAAPAASKR